MNVEKLLKMDKYELVQIIIDLKKRLEDTKAKLEMGK
jgi:hypothetical protein